MILILHLLFTYIYWITASCKKMIIYISDTPIRKRITTPSVNSWQHFIIMTCIYIYIYINTFPLVKESTNNVLLSCCKHFIHWNSQLQIKMQIHKYFMASHFRRHLLIYIHHIKSRCVNIYTWTSLVKQKFWMPLDIMVRTTPTPDIQGLCKNYTVYTKHMDCEHTIYSV